MITITIDWIRHATSCANIMKPIDIENGEYKTSEYAPDALLTDYGVQQATLLGKKYKKKYLNYKYVLTSNLRRTMETAIHMFKNHTIIPVLFVQEWQEHKTNNLENIPLDINETKKWIKTFSSVSTVNTLFLEYLLEATNNDNNPNFQNFVQYVLGYLIDNSLLINGDKIVVVTHRCFIEKHFNIKDVNNLDIFSETLQLEKKDKWIVVNSSFYKKTQHINTIDINDEKQYTKCGKSVVDYITNNNKKKGILRYISHILYKNELEKQLL